MPSPCGRELNPARAGWPFCPLLPTLDAKSRSGDRGDPFHDSGLQRPRDALKLYQLLDSMTLSGGRSAVCRGPEETVMFECG
jgi:hypothetical protein